MQDNSNSQNASGIGMQPAANAAGAPSTTPNPMGGSAGAGTPMSNPASPAVQDPSSTPASSPASGATNPIDNTMNAPASSPSDPATSTQYGVQDGGNAPASQSPFAANPSTGDNNSIPDPLPTGNPTSSTPNTGANTPAPGGPPNLPGTPGTQPASMPPAGPANASSVMTTQDGGGKGSKAFKIILIILILIALAGLGFAGYNYYLKNKMTSQEKMTPTSIPSPTFDPTSVYIDNGSIMMKGANGENTVLVNKTDVDGVGITGFSAVKVAPNDNLLCYEALPPAPIPALYISDINGGNRTEVGINRKDCEWSPDSAKIAYINIATASGETTDVFVYDVATKTEKNLTKGSAETGFTRDYKLAGWSNDSTKVECQYDQTNTRDATDKKTGSCEINLGTGVVSDLGSPPTTPSAQASGAPTSTNSGTTDAMQP